MRPHGESRRPSPLRTSTQARSRAQAPRLTPGRPRRHQAVLRPYPTSERDAGDFLRHLVDCEHDIPSRPQSDGGLEGTAKRLARLLRWPCEERGWIACESEEELGESRVFG